MDRPPVLGKKVAIYLSGKAKMNGAYGKLQRCTISLQERLARAFVNLDKLDADFYIDQSIVFDEAKQKMLRGVRKGEYSIIFTVNNALDLNDWNAMHRFVRIVEMDTNLLTGETTAGKHAKLLLPDEVRLNVLNARKLKQNRPYIYTSTFNYATNEIEMPTRLEEMYLASGYKTKIDIDLDHTKVWFGSILLNSALNGECRYIFLQDFEHTHPDILKKLLELDKANLVHIRALTSKYVCFSHLPEIDLDARAVAGKSWLPIDDNYNLEWVQSGKGDRDIIYELEQPPRLENGKEVYPQPLKFRKLAGF